MSRPLALLLITAVTLAVMLLASNNAYAQAARCEEAEGIDIRGVTSPVEGKLVKTPGDVVFIRFTGLKPGEEAEITVDVKPSRRTSLTLALLRGTGGVFAAVEERQVIVEPEGREVTFRWHEGRETADLCVKILQFSDVGELSTSYSVTAITRERLDAEIGEAPQRPEGAIDLGKLEPGGALEFTGYLSGKKTGSDYVDYYLLLAEIKQRGDVIHVVVKTEPEDAQVSLAILDSEASFALASNKTVLGEASIKLPIVAIEETGARPFYIKVSNEGGLGGDVEYTTRISLLQRLVNETGVVTIQREEGLGVVLDDFTARVMLLAGVAAVALASVIAIVREAIRRRAGEFGEVYIEEGW